ncbi:MAG TPA: glycosyltransferase [Phycisphaerae bacterium]|nr:glycosyltransferase [Phycisphaerae bacterium]
MAVRVLHIIGQIAVGGAEIQLLGLCRRIDKGRFPMAVCYYDPNPDNMVEEFAASGVELHYVDKPNLSAWGLIGQLRGVIRSFEPDVIHTWQYSPNFWGRLAAWTCGCKRLVAAERTSRVLRSRAMRCLEKLVGRRTIWLVNSHAVADAVRQVVRVPTERIRVIHNAVELPPRDRSADRAEVRSELGLLADQPIVLSVGRLTEAKNYPMLFRAARIVLSRRPDVRFLIAGQGEDEGKLRALHEQLGLGEFVRLLGLRRDVPRLLSAADAFCLSSLWEGFPNCLLEAMAAGLPVVSAAFPGVEEFFLPDRTGLMVNVDDHESLAAAILRLLDDRDLASGCGRAAQEWVQGRFSWPKLVANMEALYNDCMKGR